MNTTIKIGIGVAILLLVAGILLVIYMTKKSSVSTDSSSNASMKAVYHKISPQEGKDMMEKDKSILLIDVRTQEEYNQGRIAGSILLPDYDIGTLAAVRLPDKNAKIIVYCRSGARSKGAANVLVSLGYTNVYDMGGIIAWPFGTVK